MKIIEFKYITKQSPDWHYLDIELEEYFDLEPKEGITIDSVPRYLHLYEYLAIALEDLLIIHVVIKVGKNKREFKQTFWNNGDNFCTERIDMGKSPYKELIINSLIDKKKRVYEIIRLAYGTYSLYPLYHGFIENKSNNKEVEQKLDLDIYKALYKKETNQY